MNSAVATAVESLDALLFETGLLLQQVSQGSVKSAAVVEQMLARVAVDVQRRVGELAGMNPPASALRRIRERRETLGALEFVVRRAAYDMTTSLEQLVPATTKAGVYSPERQRLATAGAWMNVRSAP